jgi:hypothetical protein
MNIIQIKNVSQYRLYLWQSIVLNDSNSRTAVNKRRNYNAD